MKNNALIRIVDDDPICLDSIQFLLRNEGWKTLCASSAADFLSEDRPSIHGLVILDIKMPHMNGLALQDLLLERRYPHPLVFLSAHGDIDTAVGVTKKGAFDFLQKPVDPERLLEVVEKAVRFDLQETNLDLDTLARRLESLTSREQQIATMILNGISSRDIADSLQITLRTVETHKFNIYRKLSINSTAELRHFLEGNTWEEHKDSSSNK